MKISPSPLRILILSPFLLAASSPASLPLRQAADRVGLLIGTAVRPYALSEAAYAETLGREFNMVEPEDAMKWWIIRPKEDVFDFAEGDRVVRFAQAHRMKVRGHCLIWDHTNPEWLARGHFTPAQLSSLMRQHIAVVMTHYAGSVFAWDVVNEAFDESGQLKDSPWHNQPGIGLGGRAYIEQAFRWAREADPAALLFYNEGGAEGMNAKSDAVYAMVKDFRNRGIPIDGVGLQMHISQDFDTSTLAQNMERLTALGLQVHITELDIPLPIKGARGFLAEDVQRQADLYHRVAHICLQNTGCKAIQTWGFTDKYSWVGSQSHGARGGALLFDNFYKPKPAYEAMLEEITAGLKKVTDEELGSSPPRPRRCSCSQDQQQP